MAGLPAILSGRNHYISWGGITLTSAGIIEIFYSILDNSELFVEELSENKQ